MKRIFLLFSVCAILITSVAARTAFAATDITGTWSGNLSTPSGNSIPFTYVFKVDGTKLTGTVQGPRGDSRSMDNGKVDGDKFSFNVSVNGTTITNEGTVNADGTIKLNTKTSDGSFPPAELTLTRVKTDAPAPAAAAGTASIATDINGTWTGDVPTPDGNSFTLTYVFKVDGAKLTGTVQGPQGDPLSLDNGKIDGGKFSFDVSFNGITIHNDCTINADNTIKLNSAASDGSFPPSEFMLKRVKAPETPAPAPTPKPGL